MFFTSLFPDIFFSWFFGDFISYTPYHICFLVLLCSSSNNGDTSPSQQIKIKFNLCYLYTHWSVLKSGLSLKYSRVLPLPQPSWKPSLVESDTSLFCHSFWELSLVASSLGCCYYLYFEGSGWNGTKGCHRSLPCPSLSTFCLFVNNASAKEICFPFRILWSMDHEVQHGFWNQHRLLKGLLVAVGPRLQIRSTEAAWTRHRHGSSLQHRPPHWCGPE